MNEHPTVRFLSSDPDDQYAGIIERFVGREFPMLATGNVEDTMEAVMLAFIGTKNNRQGPRPNPESEVRMRDVVRRAIKADVPIPLYIPSAAVKVPVGFSSIDVAELSALRMLEALQLCIRRHYEPGLSMRMRMEDLTEYVLSGTSDPVREAVGHYITTMHDLVETLGFHDWLKLIPESSLANEKTFLEQAQGVASQVEGYLRGRFSFEQVKDSTGLLWPISQEMRQYFIERYKKLYPHYGEGDYIRAMAAYYSSTLTRRTMNASGYDPSFDGRLELYFGIKLPDAPAVSTRVYYRTVPRSQSTFHAPYWNAHGVLRIGNSGEPRISLNHQEGDLVIPGTLELNRPPYSARITADYVLED